MDIHDTVQLGRRRVRRRRTIAACASAALIIAIPAGISVARDHWNSQRPIDVALAPSNSVSASASAAPRPTEKCGVRALDLPKLPDGVVPADIFDMDPSGRYIVGDTYRVGHNTSAKTILWDNGVPRIIPVPGVDAFSRAVNSSGVVAGWSVHENADGDFYVWVYRDGKFTELPKPSGFVEFMGDALVNSAGDVMGQGITNSRKEVKPIIWRADNPRRPTVLAAPKVSGVATHVMTAALGDNGQIAGTIGDIKKQLPYLWTADRSGTVMALPDGFSQGGVSAVRDGVAIGWVAKSGNVVENPAASKPARWDLTTGKVTLIDVAGAVHTSNARGDMIVYVGGPNPLAYYHNGQAVALANLTKGSTPNPVRVSRDGTVVVGNAYTNPTDPKGTRTPVIWHCSA